MKRELEIGRARLQRLEIEEQMVRERMLRIRGAVQVIEELLDHTGEPGTADGELSQKLKT